MFPSQVNLSDDTFVLIVNLIKMYKDFSDFNFINNKKYKLSKESIDSNKSKQDYFEVRVKLNRNE